MINTHLTVNQHTKAPQYSAAVLCCIFYTLTVVSPGSRLPFRLMAQV